MNVRTDYIERTLSSYILIQQAPDAPYLNNSTSQVLIIHTSLPHSPTIAP